jgi:hypothetical protein
MTGVYFFFVLVVAVGSLMECYVKAVSQRTDKLAKGELLDMEDY